MEVAAARATKPGLKRRIAVGALLLGFLAGPVVSPVADARTGDPFVPHPPHWCPGNSDPNTVGLLRTGGFCEGQTFPDGTRWNALRVGRLWLPRRCIVFNGSATPPSAPPGGCGGVWNG